VKRSLYEGPVEPGLVRTSLKPAIFALEGGEIGDVVTDARVDSIKLGKLGTVVCMIVVATQQKWGPQGHMDVLKPVVGLPLLLEPGKPIGNLKIVP